MVACSPVLEYRLSLELCLVMVGTPGAMRRSTLQALLMSPNYEGSEAPTSEFEVLGDSAASLRIAEKR